jgi:AraC-like DNA-binding protein
MLIDWSTTRAVVGDRVGRHFCEPGWRLDRRWSQSFDDFVLWVVWGGRGWMTADAAPVALRPGVCLWMKPGVIYLARHDPNNRLRVNSIHFRLTDIDGSALPCDASVPTLVHEAADTGCVVAVTGRIVDLLSGPFRSAGDATNRRVADQLLTALLMDLDAAPQRPASPIRGGTQRHHHQLVMDLYRQINESPTDIPSVAVMARRAGYSPDHFARVFKSVVGLTPRDAIVSARVERARLLLTESSLSISQVADMLGYENVYFFSRQFKAKAGHTPSQYRKRLA